MKSLILFSDDIVYTVARRSEQELVQTLSDDMAKIDKWMHLNKLKLNYSKSAFIVFWLFKFGHATVPRRKSVNHIGVILDEVLIFFRSYSVYHFKSCAKYRNY